MMMPETEESLEAELRRTRSMLEPIERQIEALEAKGRRSSKEEKLLGDLREQKERLEAGLQAVGDKLASMRGG